jgi:hypothetical protein
MAKQVTAAERAQRLFVKAINDHQMTLLGNGTSPRFMVAEPRVVNVLTNKGTFGSHAMIGGEEVSLLKIREDGTLVFYPRFPASFKEIHMAEDKALELLSDFMPFWTLLEEKVRSKVGTELEKFTKEAKAEAIADAKEKFPDYGTW